MGARRERLEAVAARVREIAQAGEYVTDAGVRVSLGDVSAAVKGTETLSPDALEAMLAAPGRPAVSTPRIEVSGETTQEATHRLIVSEGFPDVAMLNYASATRCGGGFLTGATAQEEDLARCSALYECLATQTAYYAYHRAHRTPIYSDRLIHSPRVPFFAVRAGELLDHVYPASVITAAAPNLSAAEKNGKATRAEVEAALAHRAGLVLALARDRGHRALVLGAWGCGVFGNDPAFVADAFGRWLADPRFVGAFERIVFAVYDPRPEQEAFRAFAARFAGR